MRITDVFTNSNDDTIVKIDNLYFSYNIRENTLSEYKGEISDKLEKAVYLGLSTVQVKGDLPETLQKELKDPKYDTCNITVMNNSLFIKNYFLEENPYVDLLVELDSQFSVQVRVRNKQISSSNVTKRETILNKISIPAIAYIDSGEGAKETTCSIILGGFKEG